MKKMTLYAILSALIMYVMGFFLLLVDKPTLHTSIGIMLLGATMLVMWIYAIQQDKKKNKKQEK